MSMRRGQSNGREGDVLDIRKLSLNGSGGNSGAVVSPSPPGVAAVGFGTDNTAEKPNLNIVNQANIVTHLNANKTSFDPTQIIMMGGPTTAAEPQQQQAMIPSFLIQPSSSTASGLEVPSSASSVSIMSQQQQHRHQQQQSSAALLMPNQIQAPIPSQPAAVAAIAQLIQQPGQHRPVQIQQQQPAVVLQSLTDNTTFGVRQQAVVQQQRMQQQLHEQVSLAPQILQQQMQQPVYQEKKDYIYSDKKTLMNGRVPATRRDGRKLFVGGLPNEVTDLSFLQFFQQYGEVIDSVVLLDRRTKRSRGFGFVTFSDPNVSAALLTTIPGRTGVVNIMGKNCEVKASEPKTAEADHLAHSTINLPPSHHPQAPTSHVWTNHQTPQRAAFGTGGEAAIHPLQVNQTIAVPPSLNYGAATRGTEMGAAVAAGRSGAGVPIYSHSTITRTTAGPIVSADGASHEGAANVYIQNNFYTLSPGSELPPSHAVNFAQGLTPEALQAHQTELVRKGGVMTLEQTVTAATTMAVAAAAAPQYATDNTHSALQPMYPGSNISEQENTLGGAMMQHQKHIQTMGHRYHQSRQ
mmetsp:Transcript_28533/g.68677  ORF Transcript_28533/g.68677 Transcript_28533/m.68677 type:complete len:577 (-) Transcript_28533:234-1964(-)